MSILQSPKIEKLVIKFKGDEVITIFGHDSVMKKFALEIKMTNSWVCYDKAHEDVEDGGSRSRLTEGPEPKGDLRPTGVNRHICMTCIIRHV